MAEQKLSKKQQKALQFRKSKDEKAVEQETKKVEEENRKKRSASEAKIADELIKKDGTSAEPAADTPKKRKTRRGKKGKGVNGGKGPKFILFVGNLPYDITEQQLREHFKNLEPSRFRIRQDKGIAFLEFDNDSREIQSKMEKALAMHHTTLKHRKINVELTVGGGGNSENRKNKLKEKNEKLMEERRQKVTKDTKKKDVPEGMHPARAAMMK